MSTEEAQIGVNTNLQRQDLNNLDVSNLTALSPEVISRQATINIGTIGHVAHGKSTVVKAISGVQTVRFKNELERNITIKLERISKERLEALLRSKDLLRDYERRVENTLKMRTQQNSFNLRAQRRQYSSSPLTAPKLKTQLLSRNSSMDSVNTLQSSTLSIASTNLTINNNKKIERYDLLRQKSSSPSSGYETFTDNGSVCSVDETSANDKKINTKLRKRAKSLSASNYVANETTTQTNNNNNKNATIKRRKSLSANIVSNQLMKANKTFEEQLQKNSKRIKAPKGEYIVEKIEYVESVNGNAVFFVKWLGYASNQNTWESLENLKDCAILEEFIEDRCEFFDITIAAISAELENEIQRDGLTYDASKLSITELDAFEPLNMKIDFLLLAQFRDARSRNQKEPEKIRKRLIEMMLIKPYYYMRKRQKIDLSNWQTIVNDIEKKAPIKIENNIDLEVPDPNFEYILESFIGKSLNIYNNENPEPPIGCSCDDKMCMPTKKCCAKNADSIFAYDKNGRLRINTGEAIYECNDKCVCDLTCRNRVIQHGRKNDLTIFKTSNGCGWGVRTERSLRKGEYVCEYVGEIISCDEANERGKRYDDIGRTYLFDLDYNMTTESIYTIDAALYGNVSHFINHSCDPNLAVFPFWINNLDVNMPRLAFFTLRPIKAGEELNFDYMRSTVNESDNNVYENLSTAKKVPCRCGAQNCRGVLF